MVYFFAYVKVGTIKPVSKEPSVADKISKKKLSAI
jgi:hypothetical protein